MRSEKLLTQTKLEWCWTDHNHKNRNP